MAILLCLLAAGVPQIDLERTFELEAREVRSVVLNALSDAIKVKAMVQSAGSPVNVYLVLEKDREAALEKVLKGERPDKLLAHKEKVEEATLEAAIPAKSGFVIVFTTATDKKATVKIAVKGKL